MNYAIQTLLKTTMQRKLFDPFLNKSFSNLKMKIKINNFKIFCCFVGFSKQNLSFCNSMFTSNFSYFSRYEDLCFSVIPQFFYPSCIPIDPPNDPDPDVPSPDRDESKTLLREALRKAKRWEMTQGKVNTPFKFHSRTAFAQAFGLSPIPSGSSSA